MEKESRASQEGKKIRGITPEQETAFAIAADAIIIEPRYSGRFLSRENIPADMKDVTLRVLLEKSGLPSEKMVEETINELKQSDERSAKASGKILEWAKHNHEYRESRENPGKKPV